MFLNLVIVKNVPQDPKMHWHVYYFHYKYVISNTKGYW